MQSINFPACRGRSQCPVCTWMAKQQGLENLALAQTAKAVGFHGTDAYNPAGPTRAPWRRHAVPFLGQTHFMCVFSAPPTTSGDSGNFCA